MVGLFSLLTARFDFSIRLSFMEQDYPLLRMSLGKTFTNAIVREIGRNYGKAISNSLMGDSHSTPVRMIGGDVARMRGRTYRNKLDEAIEKFTVKGTVATFNAGINIHTQYFSLVEEANSDNVLDIGEAKYLLSEVPRVIRTLDQIKSVMLDNSDQGRADKIQEKSEEVRDFAKLVHDSIEVDKFPVVIGDDKLKRAGFLSIVGLDLWVLKGPASGLFPLLLLLGSVAICVQKQTYWYAVGYLVLYNIVSASFMDAGYFGVAKRHRAQRALNEQFVSLKSSIGKFLINNP